MLKIGPWGGFEGTPRDILEDSRRLESITVRSDFCRIYGFSFVYVNYKGQSINVGPWGSATRGDKETITMGPAERVISMWGIVDLDGVRFLRFKTNTGREHKCGSMARLRRGKPDPRRDWFQKFDVPLQQSGGCVLGFFGQVGYEGSLVALGLYIGRHNASMIARSNAAPRFPVCSEKVPSTSISTQPAQGGTQLKQDKQPASRQLESDTDDESSEDEWVDSDVFQRRWERKSQKKEAERNDAIKAVIPPPLPPQVQPLVIPPPHPPQASRQLDSDTEAPMNFPTPANSSMFENYGPEGSRWDKEPYKIENPYWQMGLNLIYGASQYMLRGFQDPQRHIQLQGVHSMRKIGPWGGTGGTPRDILEDSWRLESITVRSTDSYGGRINGFSFVYVNYKGQSIDVGIWGSATKGYVETIQMGPTEIVIKVCGNTDKTGVRWLQFKTSTGRKHTYGWWLSSGKQFNVPLQQGGGGVLGFFGRADDSLTALGVYVGGRNAFH